MCRSQGGTIESEFNQHYAGQQVQVLGLDQWDGGVVGCADYRNFTGVTYPLLIIASDVAAQYQVDRQYIVVDGDGIVRWMGPMHSLPVEQIRDTINVYLDRLVTDPQPRGRVPEKIELLSAYPNPFNGTLRVDVAAPGNSSAQVEIFNMLGQKVDILQVPAGRAMVMWAPKNLSAGRYFLRLANQSAMQSTPVIYLK